MAGLVFILAPPAIAQSSCEGDCGEDGDVTVDEILTLVAVALGNVGADACPAGDSNDDGMITVDEIVAALQRALNGCPAATSETWLISDFALQFAGCPQQITELLAMGFTPQEPCALEFVIDGNRVTVNDCGGGVGEATLDDDRILEAAQVESGQIEACEFRILSEIRADLSRSPTVVDYDVLVESIAMCPFVRCEIDFAASLTRE